jgi:hypothetical protein
MSHKQLLGLSGCLLGCSLLAFAGCVPQGGEVPTGESGSGGAAAPAGTGGNANSAAGTGGAGTSAGTGGSSETGTGGSAAATGGSSGSIDNGTGGAGGSSAGTGGTTTATDAGSSPADTASPPPASAPGMADSESLYTCTHLIGINATQEWFGAGFEGMVENGKWQMVRVHSGFVDLWANANNGFWNTAPTSACATNSKTPDRIIFIGLRFEWTDKAQWVQALTSVVKNLKDKYPGVKRIELGSFVRGPGNKPCGNAPAYRSTIHPSQDQAIDEVVATDPKLLRASPHFEVTACSDFSGNPPHFAGNGGKNVAKVVGDYYTGKTAAK